MSRGLDRDRSLYTSHAIRSLTLHLAEQFIVFGPLLLASLLLVSAFDFPSRTPPRRPGTHALPGDMLPTELRLHVLSLLPHNERVLSGRLTCRDARDHLAGSTACLSQPLPPYATQWALAAGEQHVQHLPLVYKVRLVSTAAASGCETNVNVALALLQPSIIPGMLQSRGTLPFTGFRHGDPGVTAIETGHPELLGWLVHHCPGLMDFEYVLAAAARHCNLAGLQAAAQVLHEWMVDSGSNAPLSELMSKQVLHSAVGSATPDAVAKVEWVLATGGGTCSLQEGTAAVACWHGKVSMMQWLQDRGCPMRGSSVLACALEHADLAAVRKLVEEEGCSLPEPEDAYWDALLQAAAKSADGAAKLRWLQDHGAPLPALGGYLGDYRMKTVLLASMEAGHAEVVSHLLALPGWSAMLQRGPDLYGRVGSIPAGEVLLAAGARFLGLNYAADKGTVHWLVHQANAVIRGLHELEGLIERWPNRTPADSRDLLEAVQAVVGADTHGWDAFRPTRVLTLAARRGDRDLVQYLVEHLPHLGCELDEETLVAASWSGCVLLLEWLMLHAGRLMRARRPSTPLYIPAAVNGDRATLTALRRLGVPWGAKDLVAKAVQNRCKRLALEWLVMLGAPVGAEADVRMAFHYWFGSDSEDEAEEYEEEGEGEEGYEEEGYEEEGEGEEEWEGESEEEQEGEGDEEEGELDEEGEGEEEERAGEWEEGEEEEQEEGEGVEQWEGEKGDKEQGNQGEEYWKKRAVKRWLLGVVASRATRV